jgi:hypothetical protein
MPASFMVSTVRVISDFLCEFFLTALTIVQLRRFFHKMVLFSISFEGVVITITITVAL